MTRPRLAIPVGDPAGIGPEVVLKAIADPALVAAGDLTVVGNRALLEQTYQHLRQRQDDQQASQHPLVDPEQLTILDVPLPGAAQPVMGVGDAVSGALSFQTLQTAIAHTLAGAFQGIVTGPIAKSAWKAAGHHYPGQTELLAEQAHSDRFGMLFVARSPHSGWTLRTLLATTHIPLRQVPDCLGPELMTRKLDLLVDCLRQDFGLDAAKIAIAGLNPHSGEQGQLGHEEQAWLIPWLQTAQKRYPTYQLVGPVPPDTLWVQAGQAWYGSERRFPSY